MKPSAGFDPRRLRARGPSKWRWRLGLLLAALLMLLGIGLSSIGGAALFGQPLGLGTPSSDAALAVAQLVGGLVALVVGVMLWRRWRRLLRPANSLDIDPYLLKKRD